MLLSFQHIGPPPLAGVFVPPVAGSVGESTTKSVLANLSSGFIGYAVSGGTPYAVSLYLRTARWTDEEGWHEIVNTVDGDAARNGARAQAIVSAFDGRVHAIMNDGSVLVLNDTRWQPVAAASSVAKDLFFPLAAFDPSRNVIVMWGTLKKAGGRKNDTFVFDGQTWRKAKKSVAPADDDGFDLCFDPAAGHVVRVGVSELAHFDGETWTSQPLDHPLTNWFRCVWASGGAIYVAEMGPKTVRAIQGAAVTTMGTFEAPVPRDRMMKNLPFDRWWADERGLSVHNNDDDRQSFRLVLPRVSS
jgi:hypothetical protein